MAGATCPKCGGSRQPGALECPHCGVIYAKAEQAAAAERRRQAEIEAAERKRLLEEAQAAAIQVAPEPPPPADTSKTLIPCPSCTREISRQAESCPHCGHPFRAAGPAPSPEKPKNIATKHYGCGSGCGVIGLLIVLAIIWGIASNGMQEQREKLKATQHEATPQAKTVTPPPEKPGAAVTSGTRIIRDGYFGCRNRELFKRINGMAAVGDRKAFGEALAVAILAGECKEMPAGAEAFIEGSTFLGGDVQVRIKGEIGQWWMSYQGLQNR